jgi:hypothetical protein
MATTNPNDNALRGRGLFMRTVMIVVFVWR